MNDALSSKHPVEQFRVCYWYAVVMSGLSSNKVDQNSKDELLKKIQKYATGDCTPRKALVMRVDSLISGSAYSLNHPLWFVLKKINSENFKSSSYIDHINPFVRLIVMYQQMGLLGAPLAWRKFNEVEVKALLRRGTLDELFALVLCWHNAMARNDKDEIECVVSAINLLLSVIAENTKNDVLQQRLTSLFETLIFDRSSK